MNTIEDRTGEQYLVVEDQLTGGARFTVHHKNTRAAYANVRFEGEILFIADLHVFDRAIRPAMFTLIWRFPPVRVRTSNYRGRGIGSAIIEFLKDYAKTNGFRRIEGKVKQIDLDTNAQLPDWYRRRGFIVTDGVQGAAYQISLVLNA
jgi:GNAT superfamily N-acetyltransferase